MPARPLVLALLLLALAGCSPTAPSDRGPFEGVWRVAEIRYVGPDGHSTNDAPQSGIIVFTTRHYSMIWTPGDAPRRMFAKRWQPSPEEKIASFDAVAANSGTYDWTGTRVTLHPIVAKSPDFMGGEALCEYHFAGDTLWITMTRATSRDGVCDPSCVSSVTPIKLVRIE